MEGLPDDLVGECLLRVPYVSHHNLRDVCRSWDAMVSSPEFYEDRKISGTSEQLICLFQHDPEECNYGVTVYDPAKGTWERLNDPDRNGLPLSCECVSMNRKLVVIGGVNDGVVVKTVYIYDFQSVKWSGGADMSVARSSFACSVSPCIGLIYVAGGCDDNGDSVRVVEVYDVEKDKWEILPPMIQGCRSGCPGVFMDEKFIVLGVELFGEIDESVEVFDPSAGTWTLMEDMWRFPVQNLRDSAVANSFCGRALYIFSEQEAMKYDPEKSDWSTVASLPQNIPHFTSATHWRNCFFITGCNPDEKQYHLPFMFNPSTRQSLEVKCDEGNNFAGIVLSATTVEI